ncbi:MAG: tRNA (N6-threonylcarbamoyladenosine(37)-N6)-methyltransferase TrmO [Lachnospiraceae bacterium]|nr:tRNA (N6-threonylcarbamoyladenosine(37)-N6)-methyltransferase TrmO [Candidatus Merdinaster equi]
MKCIGHIENAYKEKFGVPRQSGLANSVVSRVVFDREYSSPDAFKGIEEFKYLWLIWLFDIPENDSFRATVRPPRLGGNEHVGVFASRSPFRPNPIGLSSVCFKKLAFEDGHAVMYVSGADLKDGTHIVDVKPYIEYADSHPGAGNGFASAGLTHKLEVVFDVDVTRLMGEKECAGLVESLSLDPRPSYQQDDSRVYGMKYLDWNVRFRVEERRLIVLSISES